MLAENRFAWMFIFKKIRGQRIMVSAIFNATGKWVLDYPTTPDRVLKALGRI